MPYTPKFALEYRQIMSALNRAEEALKTGDKKELPALYDVLSRECVGRKYVLAHPDNRRKLESALGAIALIAPEARELVCERALIVTAVTAPSVADITEDFVCLENIVCTDADGNVFEQYPKLCVKKDVERNPQGQFLRFTPYNAESHFQQQSNGLFVPSFALSCNILAALFQQKDDNEIKTILRQYKNYGQGYGWHCQNTLIGYAGQQIIHYPQDSDFPCNGGTRGINTDRRKHLQFAKSGLKNVALEDALNDANTARFVRQFTCLQNPAVLRDIAEYFGKQARIWFPDGDATNCNNVRVAWLGGSYDSFALSANDDLIISSAARGVRAIP